MLLTFKLTMQNTRAAELDGPGCRALTNLDVRPGGLQGGLVLLGVKVLVLAWGEGPEDVGADLEEETEQKKVP